MEGITPEEWDREGWLALCGDHLDNFLDEEKDGYGDIFEEEPPLKCDFKGCNREADFELYPGIMETVEKVKEKETEEYVPLEEEFKAIDREINEVEESDKYHSVYRKSDKKSKGEK